MDINGKLQILILNISVKCTTTMDLLICHKEFFLPKPNHTRDSGFEHGSVVWQTCVYSLHPPPGELLSFNKCRHITNRVLELCIEKNDCTANLNVQVSTEINGYRKKRSPSIQDHIASHFFPWTTFSFVLFLWFSTTFHSSFFILLLFSPWSFALLATHITQKYNTHTEYVDTDDVTSEICLMYQKKVYQSLFIPLVSMLVKYVYLWKTT